MIVFSLGTIERVEMMEVGDLLSLYFIEIVLVSECLTKEEKRLKKEYLATGRI